MLRNLFHPKAWIFFGILAEALKITELEAAQIVLADEKLLAALIKEVE